ncbi:MAG TPA: FtsW/RodA/SpoVE family cell cycle protein, partial [Bacillota bacterium]|nr:FtsW/RodA/SpoVE family cell cycle protein [Bacillota bacterium]
MNLINRKMLRDVDLLLVIAAAAAFVYGCVVLYSATYAQPSLTSADPLSIVKKQAVAGLIGLSLALSFMIVGHSILQRAHLLVYAGSVLLLIAVTLVGTRVRGALGWIRVGGFSLQPVEFVKYGIAVALAGHLARKEGPLGIAETVVPLLMAAVPTGIVILQNDLGSALVFIPMVLAMLWAAGADTKVVLGLMAAGLFIAAPLGYFLFLDDYQKARILTFFNPGRDPFGAGYNVIQSVIGIGSGGLLG